MRLVVSGGGTAGHVYPALALLDGWEGTRPLVRWIGSVGGMEGQIVAGRGIEVAEIRAAPIRDRSPLRTVANAGILTAGFGQALRLLRRWRPDVVLTTGGYVTVPVAYAAALLRIPLVVFLPDIRPGLAVRAQARVATRIAVAFRDAADALGATRSTTTGYPLRPRLLEAARPDGDGVPVGRADARRRMGVHGSLPVVLVYGGSRGARTLNQGIAARLPELLGRCQLIHVAGALDEDAMRLVAADLPVDLAGRYHLYGFAGEDLVDALVAADLAVARSGASTLAELPAAGLASVLVPGPFSDQDANARWLADQGAAVVLTNDEVADGALPDLLLALLDDDARRAAMSAAAREVAVLDAGPRLQQVVVEAASGR